MFMNKNVFAEKEVELPATSWNKDEFLQLAQTLTYEKDGEKVYGTVAPTDYFTVTAWLYNNNASVLNEEMTECTLNSPEAVEVIQFLHDLVYKYEVAPAPSAGLDTSNLFMNGQIAMLGNGRWSIASLANNNFEDYDIQALPALSTQQSSFGSGSFPVLSSTKHPYEAMLFSSWLSASFSGNIPENRFRALPDLCHGENPSHHAPGKRNDMEGKRRRCKKYSGSGRTDGCNGGI